MALYDKGSVPTDEELDEMREIKKLKAEIEKLKRALYHTDHACKNVTKSTFKLKAALEAAKPLLEAAMKFVDDSREGLPFNAPLEDAVDAYRSAKEANAYRESVLKEKP